MIDFSYVIYSCTSKTEDKAYVFSPYYGFTDCFIDKRFRNYDIHVRAFYKL